MAYIYASFSHKGERTKNEDSILIRSARIGNVDICLGVVCDGVGGLRKGEVASRLASEFMSDWFERMALKDRNEVDYDYLKKSMIKNTYKANALIADFAERNNFRCATTISAFFLYDDKYFVINVGDSRIYIYSNGLHQLTTDDSAGNGVLTQCLGSSGEITVNTDEGVLRSKQALFICTDGFYADMDSEAVCDVICSATADTAGNEIRRIVCNCAKNGAQDNITAGFVRYEKNVRAKSATKKLFSAILPTKNKN